MNLRFLSFPQVFEQSLFLLNSRKYRLFLHSSEKGSAHECSCNYSMTFSERGKEAGPFDSYMYIAGAGEGRMKRSLPAGCPTYQPPLPGAYHNLNRWPEKVSTETITDLLAPGICRYLPPPSPPYRYLPLSYSVQRNVFCKRGMERKVLFFYCVCSCHFTYLPTWPSKFHLEQILELRQS